MTRIPARRAAGGTSADQASAPVCGTDGTEAAQDALMAGLLLRRLAPEHRR
ncbi:hypothetical protein [Streptomyces sp. col6]|uniref:hypothetical protein n=1 Tax=Streptomyces sp. col6 TaxID=2478958 RepID=UPI00174693EE|nr:hypothetical protein [Streptomyces sp. col6]